MEDGGGISNGGISFMHTLTLNNSMVNGNTAAGIGGGIRNWGMLTLNNSTVSGNIAGSGFSVSGGSGGGIVNTGDSTLILNNSTVSNNTAKSGSFGGGYGGGIESVGTMTLNNSTVSGNTASYGGGIDNGGIVTFTNTMLTGNTSSGSGLDCSGTIGSTGYNLISNTSGCTFNSTTGDLLNTPARTVSLGNYVALLPYSPAIDAGNPTGCMGSTGLLITDQRGSPRPLDGNGDAVSRCDIGAYEFDPANPVRQVFLPLVRKPKPRFGINGTIAENGVPATGISIDLRFYNGASWSTLVITTTDEDGDYFFTGVPSLSPGQYYYVRYLNASTPSRLSTWHTASLSAYTAGGNVSMGSFDIANIELASPFAGATVPLPYTFQWTRRTATPTDNYEFDLFDYADGDPYFFTDPPLGYVSSYQLNGLPPGFGTGTPYVWDMWVYSPDGGYGISYWAYEVAFSSGGFSIATLPSSKSMNLHEQVERPEDVRRHPVRVLPEASLEPRD